MACVHSFDCTCLDYSIRGFVCTHIPAVCLSDPILWSEACDDDGKDHDIEIIEEKLQGLASLVPINKEQRNCTELEDLKKNALRTIGEQTEVSQNTLSSDAIHAALCHVRSAISVARGLHVIGNDHQYLNPKFTLQISLQRNVSFPRKENENSQRKNLSFRSLQ